MDATHKINEEQAALWNGTAGQAWVDAQDVLDDMFRPFEELLVEAVPPGSRVLDVGCGTGATTLAIARKAGAAVGVDLSAPMIELARARAARSGSSATFVCADAQAHAFEAAAFDRVVSRFGVMFFADPVRAFANLRGATKGGGEARLIAWRGAAENPFMTAAERAAAPLLPDLPPRASDGPGQFAFADRSRVERILADAGWRDVALRPLDVVCALPAHALDRYVTRLGPLGRVLGEVAEPLRTQVLDAVRAAFVPFVHGAEVRYTAACWMISAAA
jgi:SAM-dependent methyltransferase